ncbi:MAG: GGDEF domain-containing protein [Janthinobacterium lividum]
MRAFKTLFVGDIQTDRALREYILRTTAICAAIALALDVVNQLTFFAGWQVALRSWAITLLISGSIAFVAARAIGRAQLALWRAKAEVEILSRTDPLTGLLNRRALLADVDQVPDSMTLLIADIDRFKQVNDAHGHLVGDEVLRRVARTMANHLGDLGRVGRLGGEEFAFLSFGVPLPELTRHLRAFRKALAETPLVVAGARVSVTVSGGIAVRRDDQSFETLYAAADRALYLAKSSGRNRILIDEATGCREIDRDHETILAMKNTGGTAAA